PRERAEPPQATRERLETPHVLDVRSEARHVHQVERPVAEDLVGDVRAVRCLDVPRLRRFHRPNTHADLVNARNREGRAARLRERAVTRHDVTALPHRDTSSLHGGPTALIRASAPYSQQRPTQDERRLAMRVYDLERRLLVHVNRASPFRRTTLYA